MSPTSLLSVTACAMCPAAAPTERDRALASEGAPAGHGYHVALHTPDVLTAPVGYHPTALLAEAGSGADAWYPAGGRPPGANGEPAPGRAVFWPASIRRPVPAGHGLIPGSRSHATSYDGRPGNSQPLKRPPAGHHPAAVNNAFTWHAPEHVSISGERCSYRPWQPEPVSGPAPAGGEALEAAASVSRAHLRGVYASVVGSPVVVRQFTAGPPPRSQAPVTRAEEDHRPSASLPAPAAPESRRGLAAAPAAVRYAAGCALLLVVTGVVVRRRAALTRSSGSPRGDR
ncbi:hypothetical protein [Streptomyces sp. NBC_00388]|uniref:hypothetical protein n=1 Tax=Streptomyces sp. NBC_00388 TaxID=2975735 RepID=UPI002E2488FD